MKHLSLLVLLSPAGKLLARGGIPVGGELLEHRVVHATIDVLRTDEKGELLGGAVLDVGHMGAREPTHFLCSFVLVCFLKSFPGSVPVLLGHREILEGGIPDELLESLVELPLDRLLRASGLVSPALDLLHKLRKLKVVLPEPVFPDVLLRELGILVSLVHGLDVQLPEFLEEILRAGYVLLLEIVCEKRIAGSLVEDVVCKVRG